MHNHAWRRVTSSQLHPRSLQPWALNLAYILGEKVPGDAWNVCEMGPTNLGLIRNGAMMVLGAAKKRQVIVVLSYAPSHVESEIVASCAGIEREVTMMVLSVDLMLGLMDA